MADWQAIADGFAEQLNSIVGLHAYSEWPDVFDPPGVIVMPATPTFVEDATFDGEYDALFDLLVMSTRAGGDARSTVKLLSYFSDVGTSSIRAAIDADTTLGGTCSDLIPGAIFGYGTYDHAGVTYTGMKYRWKVLAT